MIKDSKGYIWSGGYYNLKCIDPRKNTVRLYPGVNTVTAIEEKDINSMWVGTATGLFLLDRNSGEYQYILMPVESTYIFIRQMMDHCTSVQMVREYLYIILKIGVSNTIMPIIRHLFPIISILFFRKWMDR